MQTISTRLIGAFCALLICTAALAGAAWISFEKHNNTLAAFFSGHIVPLRDLKVISDRYAVDVVDAAHKARNGNFKPSESLKAMRDAIAEIDALWPKYIALRKSPEEQKLAAEAGAKLVSARKATDTMIGLVEKNDLAALGEFTVRSMYASIDPGTEQLGKLIDFHLEQAKNDFADSVSAGKATAVFFLIIAGLALTIFILSGIFVIFGIVRPLRNSIATMSALARNTVASSESGEARLAHLSEIEILGAERSDEIGAMARTLLTFKEAGVERQRARIASEKEQGQRLERGARIDSIVREFEQVSLGIVTSLSQSSNGLEKSAKAMTSIATEASEQSGTVAAASHEVAVSMNMLAASGDQLAASISEISRQAEQSSAFAMAASSKAQEADGTVARLAEAGSAIAQVLDLIKSIASQTNLLALNATIEAARAGESGRGFAVVASEVKELASQTSKATDVIAEHVSAIQTTSAESTRAMREITGMIEQINSVAISIASAVTQQNEATQGISENVQQVARGSESMSEGIQFVSTAAAHTGEAASDVMLASEDLSAQARLMREKVDWFLHAVRAS